MKTMTKRMAVEKQEFSIFDQFSGFSLKSPFYTYRENENEIV